MHPRKSVLVQIKLATRRARHIVPKKTSCKFPESFPAIKKIGACYGWMVPARAVSKRPLAKFLPGKSCRVRKSGVPKMLCLQESCLREPPPTTLCRNPAPDAQCPAPAPGQRNLLAGVWRTGQLPGRPASWPGPSRSLAGPRETARARKSPREPARTPT